MVTLYNVVSSDGFIARPDGREDFIPDDLWGKFLDICRKYGTLVIGRKTYETIQRYDKKLLIPFESLPIKKIIVTSNREFRLKPGYVIAHSPEDAIISSENILVSSGPTLNDFLLQKGLVDKIIFHEVPIAIGNGIKAFNSERISLLPVKNPDIFSGVKVKEYRVGVVGQ